ncbi:MAG TPA: hypothetical protein VGB20_02885 [bacterium]
MSTSARTSPWVEVGPECVIGEGVELGVASGRLIAREPAKIGRGARLRSETVVHGETDIGGRCESGHHVVVRDETVIGDRCWIWSHSTVDDGCRIGDDVAGTPVRVRGPRP